MRYLFKLKDEGGPSMWRGTAVEAGLDAVLFGMAGPQEASGIVSKKWDELALGDASDAALKEYGDLNAYLEQAIKATEAMTIPLTKQSRISIFLPEIEVPIVGYTDYLFPEFGLDLKTTRRMPSEPRPDHVDQMAVYMKATKKPFKLLYVTPKKWSLQEVTPEMAAASMERVHAAAHSIRHLLDRTQDANDALDIFAPDFNTFHWSPSIVEATKREQHMRH